MTDWWLDEVTWLLDSMLRRTGFEIVDREVTASLYAAYTCRFAGPPGIDVIDAF